MSAKQKHMVNSIKRGKYPAWVFGDSHNDDATMDEFATHTESPRFMARIEPNELAMEVDALPDKTIIISAIYGIGDDAFIVVAWSVGDGDDDVAEVVWRNIVNIDDAPFDLNRVQDACLRGTHAWIKRTIDDNGVSDD